ncbi:hypothetical protein EDB81DRAFT_446698 [Dactylonectria macrodidyma]|uniref:Uncharacterized protein n=1 Tax=Dactylonectria macrodidyma TaxID=307937 RepID=A0A9P9F4R4_9HYPO|nr:hypothetical protein EDB81DRAFT_446698 [Dactylonectria macrodidyma]
MIEMMVEVCGPVPDCEMFPEDVQHSIRKYDGDYIAILNKLFEEAISTPEDRVQNSPCTLLMLRWLKKNSSERNRNALCELLLHPHIRSFRTRAALGQHSQDSIFEVLETCRLTRTGKGIPNVFGIYLLHGPRKQGSIGRDLMYVGQSRAQQGSVSNAFGIKKRSMSHLEAILKCKAARGRSGRTGRDQSTTVQWAHRRLSHTDFEDTRQAVLSVFP